MLRREIGHKWGIAISLGTLGQVALYQRDYEAATDLLRESISIRNDLDDKGGIAWCLERLAEVAFAKGQPERTGCLYGAAQSLREAAHSIIDPGDQPLYEHTVAEIKTKLGEDAFNASWKDGRNMPREELLAYVREPAPAEQHSPPHEQASPVSLKLGDSSLTAREAEIAALIAQSKSNAEIAEALVITKRTVETHIGNILSKQGFTSRGQIAAWAIKHGLGNDLP